MRRVRGAAATLLLGLLVVLLVLATAGGLARAQRAIVDDQLALARVCASEIGFEATAHECAAIAAVLRARSSSIASGAQRYSSRLFDPARTDRRAYLAHLDPTGREPARWPTVVVIAPEGDGPSRVRPHPPWSAYRARWLALYELAGAIVRGEVRDRCEAPVEHWGMSRPGSIDMERALRAGWVRVDCGATRNAFWRVPRRGAR